MISAATFRADLTEFTNTTAYPDSAINFWINVAAVLLPVRTWGQGSPAAVSPAKTTLDIASELFVAHNLTIEMRAVKAAAAGGDPGQAEKGPVGSESVGGVSRSYDAAVSTLEAGGPFNLTNYGTRFLFMARLAGKGPVQIGVDPFATGPNPWFGPPVDNGGPFF